MRMIDMANIWRNSWALVLLAAVLSPITSAHAQSTAAPAIETGSAWTDWRDDVLASPWETGITGGGLTVMGLSSWDWGSRKRFNFNPEGWFGKDTGSGGADKLGHAFTSYAITNVLADRLVRQGRSPERAALSAALTAQALMLYVEVFDGLSKDHGFAREDVVVNLLGTGLAYARTVNPQLRDTLDFRMEYQASGYKDFRPFSDYAGQKFLLAFKVGGLPSTRDTPWRYLELQAGYYTRGFSRAEQIDGLGRSRHAFVGVGLNLNELFLGRRPTEAEAELKRATRLFFEHIQLPHTAARASHAD
jgi:hypothetical protein